MKNIEGYQGRYKVTEDGRVWSEARKDRRGHQLKGRWLKPGKTPMGYFTVALQDAEGNQKSHYVHRLVADAYLPGRTKGMEVCHEDGDRANNSVGNLRWDTRKANASDRVKHGTDSRGEKHYNAKLSESEARAIKYSHRNQTQADIAAIYGVRPNQVSLIRSGKTWKHI